jgi:hypothetical protein
MRSTLSEHDHEEEISEQLEATLAEVLRLLESASPSLPVEILDQLEQLIESCSSGSTAAFIDPTG